MTTADRPACPTCRTTIPPDAPGGACPRCLMALAFATDPGANPPPDVPADEVHRRFPGYEVLGTIGRGGMGIVYRARQKALDREVALKVLPGGPSRPAGFTDRFAREARALARLQHPGIVQVSDFGASDDGWCYLAMELVEGTNLRRVLAERRLAPHEALAIVPQVCDALQYAHDHGVVHRDIKPENILVCRSGAKARQDVAEPPSASGSSGGPAGAGNILVCAPAAAPADGGRLPPGVRVKIADFGLAKVLEGFPGSSFTRSGHTMGTPLYMAPEQVERPGDVDHRADIYSLGVVFYEMLTGELPIGRFAPPSRKSDVDGRIDEIVLRTLEKEREARFQSASAMKTEVDDAAAAGPSRVVLGRHEFRPERPRVVLAGLAAVAGGVAVWVLSRFDWDGMLLLSAAGLIALAATRWRRVLPGGDVAPETSSVVDATSERVLRHFAPAQPGARVSRLALVVPLAAILTVVTYAGNSHSVSQTVWATWPAIGALLCLSLVAWARIGRSAGALYGTGWAAVGILTALVVAPVSLVSAFRSEAARDAADMRLRDAMSQAAVAHPDTAAIRALVERTLSRLPVEADFHVLRDYYPDQDAASLATADAARRSQRGAAGMLGLPLADAAFLGGDVTAVAIGTVSATPTRATVELSGPRADFSVNLVRAPSGDAPDPDPTRGWRFTTTRVTRTSRAAPRASPADGWPERGGPGEEAQLHALVEMNHRSADLLKDTPTSAPAVAAARRAIARAEERLREIAAERSAAVAEAADLRSRIQDCLRRIDELVVARKLTEDHPDVAVERRTIARLEDRLRRITAEDRAEADRPAPADPLHAEDPATPPQDSPPRPPR